ncbi:MAG: trypsin-like peptidase domain-containing protein [Bdellovibrionota bacterium]
MSRRIPIFAALCLLAWPLSSQATPGFFSPDTLPGEFEGDPKILRSAIQASMLIWVQGDVIAASCSAQFISSDGYVATAAHCLRYISQKAQSQLGMRKKSDEKKDYEWFEVSHPSARPEITLTAQRTDIRENGIGESFYSGRARVIYVGRGIPMGYPDPTLDLPAQALQEMNQSLDDFAILKLDLHHTPCIRVRSEDPAAGDSVWDVGYPDTAKRENGFSSSGKSVYVSAGVVLDSTLPILRADGYTAEEIRRQTLSTENPEIYLNTDVDTFNRSSGSMLIDEKGLGVGLMSHSYDGPGVDAAEISYFVRFPHIRKMIEKDLGSRTAARIFSCPGN